MAILIQIDSSFSFLSISLYCLFIYILARMYWAALANEMSIQTDQERFTVRLWCTNDKKVKKRPKVDNVWMIKRDNK